MSQLAALGWRSTGGITAVVGYPRPDRPGNESIHAVHGAARAAGLDSLAGLHGGRFLVLLGSVTDPLIATRTIIAEFDDLPVVVAGPVAGLAHSATVTATALSGLRAVAGWPAAPRPVHACDLLPERVLAGDQLARAQLIDSVYRPLIAAGSPILETIVTYLGNGRGLETTARALFVHANTVRYRLRRVAELCGQAPTDPRGAFTLQLALALGRIDDTELANNHLVID